MSNPAIDDDDEEALNEAEAGGATRVRWVGCPLFPACKKGEKGIRGKRWRSIAAGVEPGYIRVTLVTAGISRASPKHYTWQTFSLDDMKRRWGDGEFLVELIADADSDNKRIFQKTVKIADNLASKPFPGPDDPPDDTVEEAAPAAERDEETDEEREEREDREQEEEEDRRREEEELAARRTDARRGEGRATARGEARRGEGRDAQEPAREAPRSARDPWREEPRGEARGREDERYRPDDGRGRGFEHDDRRRDDDRPLGADAGRGGRDDRYRDDGRGEPRYGEARDRWREEPRDLRRKSRRDEEEDAPRDRGDSIATALKVVAGLVTAISPLVPMGMRYFENRDAEEKHRRELELKRMETESALKLDNARTLAAREEAMRTESTRERAELARQTAEAQNTHFANMMALVTKGERNQKDIGNAMARVLEEGRGGANSEILLKIEEIERRVSRNVPSAPLDPMAQVMTQMEMMERMRRFFTGEAPPPSARAAGGGGNEAAADRRRGLDVQVLLEKLLDNAGPEAIGGLMELAKLVAKRFPNIDLSAFMPGGGGGGDEAEEGRVYEPETINS